MDCMLNTLASRSAIIVSAYAAASALSFGGVGTSAIVGGTMDGAYPGFVYAHNQNRKNPEPKATEMESIKTEENLETEPHNAVNMNEISGL